MQATDPRVIWGTLAIAAWGAITGTVSLLVAWRRHRQDRASLTVRPQWSHTWTERYPPRETLSVRVTNTGRRPAVVDRMGIVIRPRTFSELVRRIRRPRGRILWMLRPYVRGGPQPIGEGEFSELNVDPAGVFGLEQLYDIEQVVVADTAGRNWRSTRFFGQRSHELFGAGVVEDYQELGKKTGKRYVALERIRLQDRVLIRIAIKEDSTTSYRYSHQTFQRAPEVWDQTINLADEYVSENRGQFLEEIPASLSMKPLRWSPFRRITSRPATGA